MDIADLLVDAFGRVRESVHGAVDGLTEEQLDDAARPRSQLDRVAGLAPHPGAGRPRRRRGRDRAGLHRERLGQRFGLPFDAAAIGYGQSSAEVAAVRWRPRAARSTTTRTSTGRRCSTSRPGRRRSRPHRGRAVGSAGLARRAADQCRQRQLGARGPGGIPPRVGGATRRRVTECSRATTPVSSGTRPRRTGGRCPPPRAPRPTRS